MCPPTAKRTVKCWLTRLGCALALVSGPPVRATDPPKGEVTLSVAVSASVISAGDPIILKGILRNGTANAAWLPRRFETATGNVRVEVCPPDSKEFREAATLDLLWRLGGRHRPVWLEAGKEVACYPQMFGNFQTPGKWQLRLTARVDGDGITSPAITILVTERSERARDALDKYHDSIKSCLNRYGWIEASDLEQALEARESLGTSEAVTAITQMQLLCSLSASGGRAHSLAVNAINKHRDGLSPVWREFLDLRTARVLIEQKRQDAAEALLKEIKEPSTDREVLLDWLKTIRGSKK